MDSSFIQNRITSLRLKKGVSEYKMGYDLGHSRGYVNNISSGKALPSMAEFLAICEYFEIKPAEFFDEESEIPAELRKTVDLLRALDPGDLDLIRRIAKRLSEQKEKAEP